MGIKQLYNDNLRKLQNEYGIQTFFSKQCFQKNRDLVVLLLYPNTSNQLIPSMAINME